ncbi:MAG TPA: helix-turn-helix domain-containing protein [Burkholderiaceae bacterium]
MSQLRYPELARIVAEARQRLGSPTQAEFAQRLGISQQSVSRWEAGSSRPRSGDLAGVAQMLQIDVAALRRAAGYDLQPAMSTTVSYDQPLPLAALSPDSFERFCRDLLSGLYRTEQVKAVGKTGHAQAGADITVTFADRTEFIFQCKRHQQFGPADVLKAVRALKEPGVKQVLLLSRVASPATRAEIRKHTEAGWELWDQEDLSSKLRSLLGERRRQLVDTYFPGQRRALLGEPERGPWQSLPEFQAPQLVENAVFHHAWPLIGLKEELVALDAAFAESSVRVVSVLGAAGGGKSRLLLETLERFRTQHRGVDIHVASPTDEIRAQDFEALGSGPQLLVVDDAHDREDIAALLRYILPRADARVLLVYRSYALERMERELGRAGLVGPHLARFVLVKPPKQRDAIELAREVLTRSGGDPRYAKRIAALAAGSPLAVVVGSQVVAKGGKQPEQLGTADEFRQAVLLQYQKVIAEDVAEGADRERVQRILEVFALVQPALCDDGRLQELIAAATNVDVRDVSRLLRLLTQSGVLLKRGSRHRLAPDLLADTFIETGCLAGGRSTGLAERVIEQAPADFKEQMLVNLSRLDWRRGDSGSASSRLLDSIWAGLQMPFRHYHPDIDAAVAAGYYQPRRALDLAARLMDEGHGGADVVCRLIRQAAYTEAHLLPACELLWELGRTERRTMNPHPSHPIRLLKELATPEPNKPDKVSESVVDFALGLLDDDANWTANFHPFDILKGALATSGQRTMQVNSRELAVSQYTLSRNKSLADVRERVIDALITSLAHKIPLRAYLAADSLDEALRGPMAASESDIDIWGNEFAQTLERVDRTIEREPVRPTVLVRVAQAVRWHAFFGPAKTRPIAQKILGYLSRDLATRLTRWLMDAWSTTTWEVEEQGTLLPRREVEIRELMAELHDRFPNVGQLAAFVDATMADVEAAVPGDSDGPARTVLWRLFEEDPALARHVAHMQPGGQIGPSVSTPVLARHAGRAAGALFNQAPDQAREIYSLWSLAGTAGLALIAEAYRVSKHPDVYAPDDLRHLRAIFGARDPEILILAPDMARQIIKRDPLLAAGLLADVEIGVHERICREVFLCLGNAEVFPLELFTDAQLAHLVAGLRHAKDLEDFWVNRFLQRVTRHAPNLVLELAKARIDDAVKQDALGRHALGHAFRDDMSLDLMAGPDGPRLLRDLLDWALTRIDDRRYTTFLGDLVRMLCRELEASTLQLIEDWLAPCDEKRFIVVSEVLRAAPPTLLFEHGPFIRRLLQQAKVAGRQVHRGLTRALVDASISGVRTGRPGEPFEADKRLKAHAEEQMTQISRVDAAYELYRELYSYATQSIDQQLRQGRLMDEEDEA